MSKRYEIRHTTGNKYGSNARIEIVDTACEGGNDVAATTDYLGIAELIVEALEAADRERGYASLAEGLEAERAEVARHAIEKSNGHIGFSADNKVEFYELDGEVFRAPVNAVVDVHTGARIGRWECSRKHFDEYREVAYSWVGDSEAERLEALEARCAADDEAIAEIVANGGGRFEDMVIKG